MRASACGLHDINDGLRVITAVGDKIPTIRQPCDQFGHHRAIGCLTGAQTKAQGQAIAIDDSVYLCTQSSTRTANGVIRTPFLPPAAC